MFRKKKKVGDANNTHRSMGRGRYLSKKVQIDGYWFDSGYEGEFYRLLKKLKEEKVIKDFTPHPPAIMLIPAQYKVFEDTGKREMTLRETKYNPDFSVILGNGQEVILDTKTIATLENSFIIKIKIALYYQDKPVYLVYPPMWCKERRTKNQMIIEPIESKYTRLFNELNNGTFRNVFSKAKLNALGY